MKRSAEYLVCKRDGRQEWLRATKLARSIEQALIASGTGEAWQALEIAETVIAGLRRRVARGDGSPPADDLATLDTATIARTVERVLYATGFMRAAVCYTATRAERDRRQRLIASRTCDPLLGMTSPIARSDRPFDRN